MPFNRRMDKENVVHIHNGVLCSRENNDIMKFAGKWMELENVILSESCLQGTQDKYHKYSLPIHGIGATERLGVVKR
ncbi:hypothetical protein STEG23_010604, partial [Scotinomys teguina]